MNKVLSALLICSSLTACGSRGDRYDEPDREERAARPQAETRHDEPDRRKHARQADNEERDGNDDRRTVYSDSRRIKGFVQGNPAPHSHFRKLKIGMGQKEVWDLIGPPTDSRSYMTGKAWIPHYHGRDAARHEEHYHGMGTLVFNRSRWSSNLVLIGIIHDATSSGYIRH